MIRRKNGITSICFRKKTILNCVRQEMDPAVFLLGKIRILREIAKKNKDFNNYSYSSWKIKNSDKFKQNL